MPKPWDDDPNQIFDPNEPWFLASEKPEPESPRAAAFAEVTKPWSEEVLLCAVCQGRNPLDHQFCGHCGVHLQLSPAQVYQLHARSEAAFQPPPLPVPPPSASVQDDELQFLRLKAMADSESSDGSSRRWLYLIGALAMILAGFIAYQYFEQPRSRTSVSTAQTTQPASAPQLQAETPAPTPVETAPSPTPSDVAQAESPKPASTTEVQRAPEAQIPATKNVQGRKLAATVVPASRRTALNVAPAEGGGEELAQAQRFLSGTSPHRDPSAAVQWLWKAVSKQNTHAVLLLSDLYMNGDGVPKSCEQARLLLTTAAKKGDAEAVQKLRNVASQGCK